MCVCMHVFVCVYIYICMCVCIYIHIYKQVAEERIKTLEAQAAADLGLLGTTQV
jgi:hypothetical protein